MPSNNTKYSEEMRTQTAAYILESGKSATSVAEENGINMPPPREIKDDRARNKELEAKLKEKEKELKRLEKQLADERDLEGYLYCVNLGMV